MSNSERAGLGSLDCMLTFPKADSTRLRQSFIRTFQGQAEICSFRLEPWSAVGVHYITVRSFQFLDGMLNAKKREHGTRIMTTLSTLCRGDVPLIVKTASGLTSINVSNLNWLALAR